jgi:predicted nucleotidyltransferase
MRFPYVLDDIFANRSTVRVLRVLDELPDGLAVSARELARRSRLSHPTVSSVLASLLDEGVVQARRAPRADAFELNRRHVIVEKLRSLFAWERQLLQELAGFIAKEIQKHAPHVDAAYLHGSIVRGEMRPNSDIDLAVIVVDPIQAGDAEAGLVEVADAVRARYGGRLDVTIGTSALDQLRRPGRPGHRLWTAVAREGISVIDETAGAVPTRRTRPARA